MEKLGIGDWGLGIGDKKNKFKRFDSTDSSNNFKFTTIKNSTNTNEK